MNKINSTAVEEVKIFNITTTPEKEEFLSPEMSRIKGHFSRLQQNFSGLISVYEKKHLEQTQTISQQKSQINALQQEIRDIKISFANNELRYLLTDVPMKQSTEELIKLKKIYTSNIELIDKELHERNQNEMSCIVCLDKKKTVLFLPCQHLSCCKDCSEKLTECPICRKNIEQKLKVFL